MVFQFKPLRFLNSSLHISNNKNSFALDTPNYWVKMGTRALIIGGLVGILYIGYQISNYSYKMIDNTISSPIMQQIENMNK